MENKSDIYISVEKFSEYGLGLHIDYSRGSEIILLIPIS